MDSSNFRSRARTFGDRFDDGFHIRKRGRLIERDVDQAIFAIAEVQLRSERGLLDLLGGTRRGFQAKRIEE